MNKIVYIIGNHDAEMILPNVQAKFLQQFSEEARGNFSIITPEKGEYIPAPGVILQHGHEYEMANYYEPSSSVIVDDQGKRFLLPPWGSYFVTRVINKFKEERPYVNSVRPIKKFFINGLIYDTLFTIRLIIANIYYLLMVRFITYYKESRSYKKIRERLNDEFQVFRDSELLGSEFFADHPESTVLVMGHTHQPHFRSFIDGRVFINTGTWTKMYNLDLGKKTEDFYLTYAQIDIMDPEEKGSGIPRDHMDVALNVWRGHHNLPYYDYRS